MENIKGLWDQYTDTTELLAVISEMGNSSFTCIELSKSPYGIYLGRNTLGRFTEEEERAINMAADNLLKVIGESLVSCKERLKQRLIEELK